MTNDGRHYVPCHTKDECHYAWDCNDHGSQWLHNTISTLEEKAMDKPQVKVSSQLSSGTQTNKHYMATLEEEKDILDPFCGDYERMVTGTLHGDGPNPVSCCHPHAPGQQGATPAYLDTI